MCARLRARRSNAPSYSPLRFRWQQPGHPKAAYGSGAPFSRSSSLPSPSFSAVRLGCAACRISCTAGGYARRLCRLRECSRSALPHMCPLTGCAHALPAPPRLVNAANFTANSTSATTPATDFVRVKCGDDAFLRASLKPPSQRHAVLRHEQLSAVLHRRELLGGRKPGQHRPRR